MKHWLLGYPGAMLLVLVYAVLALSAASTKSCHFDEHLHIISGYSYWLTNDYRLQPENGNWPQRWVTLPFLLTGPKFPSLDQKDYRVSDPTPLARQFLFRDNDADALLMQSRGMVVILAMALGLMVYGWSRRLFGPAGGMISLALYVFSPTVLANGAIATSDLAASFFFLASVLCLWRLLQEVSVGSLFLSCAAMTGLFLSKFSAGLVVPIGVLMVIVRLAERRPFLVRFGKQARPWGGPAKSGLLLLGLLCAHVACVDLCIWASFGFRYAMFAREDERAEAHPPWAKLLELDSKLPLEVIQWGREHRLLPEAYLYGLAHTLHFARNRIAFLHGRIRNFGWRSFFPLAFLWKTPLPVFVLMALAIASWIRRRHNLEPDAKLANLAPLLILLAVYWVAAIFSHLNIGHRHLLPTYPPLFILCGAAALWFAPGRSDSPVGASKSDRYMQPAARALCLAAVAFLAGETCFYYPHYLAYFNQTVGGPSQCYRFLVDSSCDWGQEMKDLKRWLDEHPQAEPVYHFNFGLPGDYILPDVPEFSAMLIDDYPHFIKDVLRPGVYCIAATSLQNLYSERMGHWNRQYQEEYDALGKYLSGQKRAEPALHQRFVAMANNLTIARLMSYLRRKKEPFDQVGYSKLIYRLTQEDLREALDGPPCETVTNIDDNYLPPRYAVDENGQIVSK